jgi:hypothetical protein
MMTPEDIGLPPHLQRMVNAGVSGLDIMHGELKNLMLIAEQDLAERIRTRRSRRGNGFYGPHRMRGATRYALVELYQLTYQLSFAIGAKEGKND